MITCPVCQKSFDEHNRSKTLRYCSNRCKSRAKYRRKIGVCITDIRPIYDNTEDNFWSKVDIKNKEDCWEWTSCRNRDGYGQFRFNGLMKRAHRVAWCLTFGKIPKNICVLHRCDNPGCVNPSHLFLGTHQDNMADMAKKQRCYRPSGESHHKAKLTKNDVRKIRKIYADGQLFQKEISEMFDVDRTTISNIVTRRTWKEIE